MADISKLEERAVYYEFDENQMKNIKEMKKIIFEHETRMNRLIAGSEKKKVKKHLGGG